jgi:hypothetical protein
MVVGFTTTYVISENKTNKKTNKKQEIFHS